MVQPTVNVVQSGVMPCELLVVKGTRFQSEADMLQAIHRLRSTVNTTTGGAAIAHNHSALLRDLKRALINMRQVQPSAIILQSIMALRDTVSLSGSADLAGLLGDSYCLRWEVSKDPSDLAEAQRLHRLGVELSTSSRICENLLLSGLANDHIAQYEQDHRVSDAESAYSLMKQAMAHITEEHEHHILFNSGMAQAVALPLSSHYNPAQTFDLLEQIMSHEHSSLTLRLSEALRVMTCIERNIAPTWTADEPLRLRLLNVYDVFISYLTFFSALGFRKDIRMHVIVQGRHLPIKAASYALALSRPDVRRAIGYVDSARTTVLTQISQIAIDIQTNVIPTALMAEAKAVTTQFMAYRDMFPTATTQFLRPECAIASRLMRFMGQYQRIVGTKRPRAHLSSENIANLGDHGPVVMLFAEAGVLWALVSQHSSREPAAHPITDMTYQQLYNLAQRNELYMQSTMETRARGIRKETSNVIDPTTELDLALEQLWIGIVQPLIRILGLKKQAGAKRPRVTLCPNGIFTFLPLHAAGVYQRTGVIEPECISDYMVVSYTPAIKAMENYIKKATHPLSKKKLRALLVAVPESFGMDSLPQAMNEVEAISQLLPPGRRIDVNHVNEKIGLFASGDTANDVLLHLPEADILHLACHGRSDEFSFDTGFLMADRVLRVSDLMFQHLPRARFAFLGACETAKPGRAVPHSAMHLAATLLYAGFHSVIGTMWTMDDIDGKKVSLEVYTAMLAGDGDEVDLNVVPYALDTAIRKLREAGVSSDRWATYMHFGV